MFAILNCVYWNVYIAFTETYYRTILLDSHCAEIVFLISQEKLWAKESDAFLVYNNYAKIMFLLILPFP